MRNFLEQRVWTLHDQRGEPVTYIVRRFHWWNPVHQWHRAWHEVWGNHEYGRIR